MPVGVRRSPSRLAGEVPLPPSHAVHGPADWRQQPARLVQSRSVPCVDARLGATTVISCAALPVSSLAAKVGAHAVEVVAPEETETPAARTASVSTSSFTGLQTTDDGRRPARRARAPGAAVRPHRLTRDGGPAAAFLARGLPGLAGPAAAPAADLLGVRRPRPYGHAGRERPRCLAAHARLLAPLRRALPDPAHAADRRVRRQRRALARRRQHRRVQLPLRGRVGAEALVGARLRARDRREPGREPVPRSRPRPPARRARLPRPLSLPPRDGRSRRPARECLRVSGLAVGRPLDRLSGLPALLVNRRIAL